MHAESEIREPLILGTKTYRQITDDIIAPIEGKASKGWYVLLTIFAVMCAAIFVMLHTGRPWLDYMLFPLPNQFGSLWPNFNSPLLWDVFAVSTYFTVSLVFWYIGLIPDFGMIRDRVIKPWQKKM